MIVYATGVGGLPTTQLLGAWAAAGYVVTTPAFPITSLAQANPQDIGDYVNQPVDMSFVLTQMLRESRDPKRRLHGAIDRRHVGAAGISIGGASTYLAVFDDCCRDRRFSAAMELDGVRFGNTPLDGHLPLLIAHSDTDPGVPYAIARAAYDAAAPPIWLVTLHGAPHYQQWTDDPTPYDALAERFTTDFWDATLRGEKAALIRLHRDATVNGLSSIESRR